MFRRLLGVLALVSFVAPCRAAAGQEALNYASVSGRVTDPQRAAVAGAHVTARQLATNISSETSTAQDGRFRFPYLKVGQYEIAVHAAGFKDVRRTLTASVGAAFELPIGLELAGIETNVTVSAEP